MLLGFTIHQQAARKAAVETLLLGDFLTVNIDQHLYRYMYDCP